MDILTHLPLLTHRLTVNEYIELTLGSSHVVEILHLYLLYIKILGYDNIIQYEGTRNPAFYTSKIKYLYINIL